MGPARTPDTTSLTRSESNYPSARESSLLKCFYERKCNRSLCSALPRTVHPRSHRLELSSPDSHRLRTICGAYSHPVTFPSPRPSSFNYGAYILGCRDRCHRGGPLKMHDNTLHPASSPKCMPTPVGAHLSSLGGSRGTRIHMCACIGIRSCPGLPGIGT
ncbi:hypothetical protein EDB85DRAFT_1999665 [Lactarius pseudohatsudake]|nr:hypothetical protein EDB85DRAFT_1999665 [Lactarius pseudohatsudake]